MASNIKTQKFVVAKGRFAIDGNAYELGQLVELTDAQVKRVKLGDAIGDILEPYTEKKTAKVITPPNTGDADADADANNAGDDDTDVGTNSDDDIPQPPGTNTPPTLESVRAEYKEIFGKDAHPQAKVETLQNAINAKKAAPQE